MSKLNSNTLGNTLYKPNGHLEFHLLEILKSKNISKYALSKATNIRYDTICNYCTGKVTLINAEYIKIFCDILDCNISDIVEFVKD